MGVSGWFNEQNDSFKDELALLGMRAGNSWGFELYYKVAINKWLHFTADLQLAQPANKAAGWSSTSDPTPKSFFRRRPSMRFKTAHRHEEAASAFLSRLREWPVVDERTVWPVRGVSTSPYGDLTEIDLLDAAQERSQKSLCSQRLTRGACEPAGRLTPPRRRDQRPELAAGLEPPSAASSPDFTGRIWTVAVRSVGR
jgi:hypothetical protein